MQLLQMEVIHGEIRVPLRVRYEIFNISFLKYLKQILYPHVTDVLNLV